MMKECRVATVLVLAVVFCFALGSLDQAAGQRVKTTPVWQITRDGTDTSVRWVKHRPNPRFWIYNVGGGNDLVLDRETGLVWEREPHATERTFTAACNYCYDLNKGGRMGWRLPAIEELTSLVDEAQLERLPKDHPFTVSTTNRYWSSTTDPSDDTDANTYRFGASGGPLAVDKVNGSELTWCVRGGKAARDTY